MRIYTIKYVDHNTHLILGNTELNIHLIARILYPSPIEYTIMDETLNLVGVLKVLDREYGRLMHQEGYYELNPQETKFTVINTRQIKIDNLL